ncbi:MAG: O-acetyl-ADP-ribose deacetylase [Lentisphaerae bacterium RIFOXYB12_FULL_65_16]|nr:MAG: O-acetyl-ADP-ribose deacetylase [Lentisphaerae bacterium RIFOXYA12_64_32]OGV83987.1 MAG: O-acetyl-ADP-ribose deacetylase [Lentisphaerae bacterium RIFOXYB12_FULL_65_16]
MKITLVRGDITKETVDAIVNAANAGLMGGGGVDGAIHRAAGPALAEECRKIREKQGGCRTGEAVMTGAGKLKAKYVIHTPGPVWKGGGAREPELLANCYCNSLRLAEQHDCRSIAFPSISTGVYGYPIEKAVKVVFDTVLAHAATTLAEVRFVMFSEPDYKVYCDEQRRRQK